MIKRYNGVLLQTRPFKTFASIMNNYQNTCFYQFKNFVKTPLTLMILMFVGFTNAYAEGKVGVIKGGANYSLLPWFKKSFLEITEDVEEAKEGNKHVMLFFHLDGCPYCEQMVQNFDKAFLKGSIQENFEVIAINIRGDLEVAMDEDQTLSEKALAAKIGVQWTPTVVFLNQKNEIVAKTNGYRTPQKFKQVLDFVRHKAYETQTLAGYIEGIEKSGNYRLKQHSMYRDVSDFSSIETPLAVIFEDKECDACEYFYNTTLKDKITLSAFDAFTVVRLDANSTRAIVDNDGDKTTPKAWAKELNLNYRPGIVLFNQGDEITRIDGFLYAFHFREALRYVSGGFYQQFATYGTYLAYRQKQLLAQGIDIDISK